MCLSSSFPANWHNQWLLTPYPLDWPLQHKHSSNVFLKGWRKGLLFMSDPTRELPLWCLWQNLRDSFQSSSWLGISCVVPSPKCAFPWLIWNKFCSSGPANIPWTAWSCTSLLMSLSSSPALTLCSFSGPLSLCLQMFSLHHWDPASLWSQFPPYYLLWLS